MTRVARALAALLLAAATAIAQAPPPVSVRVLDWMAAVPASWTVRVPTSEMRLAQFSAASPGGTADVAVFYFGATGGGSVDENVRRWRAQFTDEGGKPARPAVEKGTASGMPVTRVALDGRHRRASGPGAQVVQVPDQSLRVAILETPRGNLAFQLWGDRAAVVPQEAAFRALVDRLKPAP